MTIEIHNIGKLRVTEEAAGAFASDVTDSATYVDVPATEGSVQLTLTQGQLNPRTLVQYIDDQPKMTAGPKSWTLNFSMPLGVWGTAAGSVPAYTTIAQAILLKTIFGGQNGSGASDTTINDASPTTTTNTWTAVTNFAEGTGYGLAVTAGFEIRDIATISTLDVTPKIAHSSAPSNTDPVYQCQTFYPAENPGTSLQFVVEGVETDDRWLLCGGQGSVQLRTPINELAMLEFSISGTNWLHGDDVTSSTPLDSMTAITAATYTKHTPVLVTGEFIAENAGTTTRTLIAAQNIQWTLNFGYGPVKSPSGSHGLARWRRQRATDGLARIEFDVPYEIETTWFEERDSTTTDLYHFQFQLGSTAGSSFAVIMPEAEIVDVQRTDVDGIAAQHVVAVARNDRQTQDGIDTSETHRAAVKFIFG